MEYDILSASLDHRSHCVFLLTFAPLPVHAEQEREPESQPRYICISSNPPNPRSCAWTQPDQQSYLFDPEAWATGIISCIPLNLWLLVICITVLKGSKYSFLGKICYCRTQKHTDYRKNPRTASKCLWKCILPLSPCTQTHKGQGKLPLCSFPLHTED